jgi:hypothetical protein
VTLLGIVLVFGLFLLIMMAGLGRFAAHDQELKQRAASPLAGLVRHLLGVYTRGP